MRSIRLLFDSRLETSPEAFVHYFYHLERKRLLLKLREMDFDYFRGDKHVGCVHEKQNFSIQTIVSVSIEISELFKLRTKTEYILNKTFDSSLLQTQ